MQNPLPSFSALLGRGVALLTLLVFPLLGWGQVVISQVYGGGNNVGATYRNDFIELHNNGTSAVSLSTYTVQYFSSTGTSGGAALSLVGSIQPGAYYLIQEAGGATNGVALPTPEATGTVNLNGTNGRVDLVNSGTLIDRVGYGPTTAPAEGTPTAVLNNTAAAIRKGSGCTDTNDNNADFDLLTPSPRNSSSQQNQCATNSINAPTFTATALCATSATTVDVTFTASGTYTAGNTFTVELSNASGTFLATPVSSVSATNTSTAAQTLTLPIPVGTPSGTGYKVRVLASAPTTTSPTSVASLTIVSNPTVTIAPTPTSSTNLGTAVSFTGTETPSPATSREWLYGTVSGSYPTASGITTTTYSFNPAATGIYFVVLRSEFPGCGAVVSAETQVTVTAPAPSLTATPNSRTGFTYVLGAGPSASQNISLTGSNLTAGPITITGSTNYEVSTDNSFFDATATVANAAGGTLAGTPIYIRLKAGLPVATYNGETIAITGGGTAAPTNVTVSGSVTAPVVITLTVDPTFLTGFSTVQGNVSTAKSYLLTASNLPAGATVLVTAPSGYEVGQNTSGSTSASGGYGATQTVTQATIIASGRRIYVRLAAVTPAGTYGTPAAPFNVTNATAGATTQSVAVDGVVNETTLAVTPGGLTNFSTTQGTASASQSYILTADNLPSTSATITVTAPTGYEVGQGTAASSTTSSYAATQTVSSATVSATGGRRIYVRLAAATPAGTYGTSAAPFNVTNATAGATTQSVAVDGVVTVPPPTLTVTPSTLTTFNTAQGTASASQSYVLTGSNLLGDVTVTPPTTEYEVSQTSATTGFAATQTVAPTAGSVSTTIYVRLAGTTAGTYGTAASPLQIANTSLNATTRNVDVKGKVLATEPTTQPGVTVANAAVTQADVTVTGGNGTNQLVVIRLTSSAAVAPTDGSTYNANATYGTGFTTGTNNFVIFAGTTGANTFTVTGLAGNTSYTVDAYAFSGSGGFENYLTLTPGTFTFITLPVPAATYTWAGLDPVAPTSYNAALNWAPPRTSPTSTDQLVFDGAVTPAPTVTTDFTSQTIAQLGLTNGANVTFNNLADRTLTINNGNTVGADLVIGTGSTLTVTNTAVVTTGLTLQLGTAATAGISGNLVFDKGAQRLLGPVTNGIEFLSGSSYKSGLNMAGSPFGTAVGNANKVIFRSGSRLEQAGGLQPFGLTAPSTAITLEAGSLYVYSLPGVSTPPLSSRTFGNLEFDVSAGGNATSTANGALVVLGDLTITSGNVRLNLDNTISIGGNLAVNAPSSTLTFIPAAGAVEIVRFNGTAPQTIGGTASANSLTFGPTSTLEINNATGVTLARPLDLTRLTLTSGTLSTDATNLLTLADDYTLTVAASGTSFVNGPLAHVISSVPSAPRNVLFPIGRGTAYRPLTLNLVSQVAASTYTAVQVEGNPGQALAPGNGLGTAPLQRVSRIRSYAVTSSNTTAGNFSGTIMLSFEADDRVNVPNDADFVIAKRNATGPFANLWTNLGRSANTGTGTGPGGAPVAGTLTSATFSDFSDFALGAQNALDSNPLGVVNPLPVELTSFTAQRQDGNAVAVKWATATEKNSTRFEVQRSLNGREFATVATVAAQGNSTQPIAYATLDQSAPAAALYYRLRQVDRDGTTSFSPTVSVKGAGLTTKVLLYPNPAQSRISFLAEAATPYSVLNQLGQTLLHGTTEAGTATVPVAPLPAGLYLLELQTPTGRVVQKFEKE
jgi:hypothetical protein